VWIIPSISHSNPDRVMLSEREIADWAPHARWATPAQIEQDLLITRGVGAIFNDSFLREQVAMRGGTVLQKVHLAPAARYSEDIDLVAVGNRPGGHLMQALERVLTPIMRAPPADGLIERVLLSIRNAALPSEIAKQTYEYAPTGATRPSARLKVEVNLTERTPVFPVVTLPLQVDLPEGLTTFQVVSSGSATSSAPKVTPMFIIWFRARSEVWMNVQR